MLGRGGGGAWGPNVGCARYELSVSVSPGLGPFWRTRVVTLRPRFILENHMPVPVTGGGVQMMVR